MDAIHTAPIVDLAPSAPSTPLKSLVPRVPDAPQRHKKVSRIRCQCCKLERGFDHGNPVCKRALRVKRDGTTTWGYLCYRCQDCVPLVNEGAMDLAHQFIASIFDGVETDDPEELADIRAELTSTIVGSEYVHTKNAHKAFAAIMAAFEKRKQQ